MECGELDLSYVFSTDQLEYSKADNLEDRITAHRNEYYRQTMDSYLELLPTVRKWINFPNHFNYLKADWLMRNGREVAVGFDKKGNLRLIGYINNTAVSSNPVDLFSGRVATENDVTIIDGLKNKFHKKMVEITQANITETFTPDTSRFVILRNKPFALRNDVRYIMHNVNEMCELATSIFVLEIVAKVTLVFRGEAGNETTNAAISKILSHAPIMKINKGWNFDQDVFTVDNTNLADTIEKLQKRLDKKTSDLNAGLGIRTNPTNKESGVTVEELQYNENTDELQENVFLSGINQGLKLLNSQYDKQYEVTFGGL